jgi:hypothetical protein
MSIDKNLAEEFFEFLDSPTWVAIVKMMEFDARVRRRTLLTSTTVTEQQRFGAIYALATYNSLCHNIYNTAGRKMPPELIELFTGSKDET